MKTKALKISGIIAGIVLFIFIVTNPTLKQFKEYLGNGNVPSYLKHARRESNFFVFSIYKIGACQGCNNDLYYWDEESYIGFLSNFKRTK